MRVSALGFPDRVLHETLVASFFAVNLDTVPQLRGRVSAMRNGSKPAWVVSAGGNEGRETLPP